MAKPSNGRCVGERERLAPIEPSEFASIREQCNLSLREVHVLLDCAYVTWHHQESGRRKDRRFGALARAVPWLIRGDLPPWCEEGAKLAAHPRLLAVHASRCIPCWDTLQAMAQVLCGANARCNSYRPRIRIQEGEKLRPLAPWWKRKVGPGGSGLRPCTICKELKLSESNKSGLCQKCRDKVRNRAKRQNQPHVWDWRTHD